VNSSVRRVSVLTIAVLVFVTGLYGVALAHTPHVGAVQVTWNAWHLTGRVAGVSHTSGTQTYSSNSKASWSHSHTFFAKIEWLDDHGAFWDAHGVKTATNTGTQAQTANLSFTATICRDYKFIGGFRNDSHGSGEQPIDEAQGVMPFSAAC
jgi:hypothetical protein